MKYLHYLTCIFVLFSSHAAFAVKPEDGNWPAQVKEIKEDLANREHGPLVIALGLTPSQKANLDLRRLPSNPYVIYVDRVTNFNPINPEDSVAKNLLLGDIRDKAFTDALGPIASMVDLIVVDRGITHRLIVDDEDADTLLNFETLKRILKLLRPGGKLVMDDEYIPIEYGVTTDANGKSKKIVLIGYKREVVDFNDFVNNEKADDPSTIATLISKNFLIKEVGKDGREPGMFPKVPKILFRNDSIVVNADREDFGYFKCLVMDPIDGKQKPFKDIKGDLYRWQGLEQESTNQVFKEFIHHQLQDAGIQADFHYLLGPFPYWPESDAYGRQNLKIGHYVFQAK